MPWDGAVGSGEVPGVEMTVSATLGCLRVALVPQVRGDGVLLDTRARGEAHIQRHHQIPGGCGGERCGKWVEVGQWGEGGGVSCGVLGCGLWRE